MLEYSLHENPLTDRKDDYAAQVHCKVVYTREGFISLMLQRGTLVTKTDIVAVLNDLEETLAYVISTGGMVNLPILNTSFSISGVFDSVMDVFDPSRHKLHVNVHKGTVLREAEKEVKVTKVNTASPQPQILEVRDSVSGKVDEILTPGGVIEIEGIDIKVAGKNMDCGLFFVPLSSGRELMAETLVRNLPSTIIALIPQLAAGEYQIKIVTQYSGSKDLKDSKTTIYNKLLKVL
jgi:hypothetical protein